MFSVKIKNIYNMIYLNILLTNLSLFLSISNLSLLQFLKNAKVLEIKYYQALFNKDRQMVYAVYAIYDSLLSG